MTDTPNNDDWLPETLPPNNVLPMRPVDRLARDLDQAPVAEGGKPKGKSKDEPPGQSAEGGGKRRDPARPHGEIWEGCPVKALGINGKVQYFLDIHGQLQPETKLEIQTISRMFGNRQHLLFERYPRYARGAKKPTPKVFDASRAMSDMVAACADRGLFDPIGAVRGVGAWTDDDGQLIYHTGDKIYYGDQVLEPTSIGGRIYPAQPPIPHPALSVKGAGPIEHIRAEFSTWQWRRGDLDTQFAIGMMGCLLLGGALIWRPAFWVTGGKSTGKSRLQTLINHLLGGDKGVFRSEDSTAASISNSLRLSTIPVALDELEPGDAGSRKEQQIIQLLRLSASGGRRTRSAADQSTTETVIRSTFLASSILIPPLEPQDRSRIIVLDLHEFPPGTEAPPPLRASVWQPRGLALKRLLIDRWPTWDARLDNWRKALAQHGIDGRNGDNLATLMAMSEMAESPEPWEQELIEAWAGRVAAEIRVDLSEIGSDADEVLTHLLSQPYEAFTRGEHYTVAQWVMVAGRLPGAPAGLMNDFGLDDIDQDRRADAANAKLAKATIKFIRDPDNPRLFVGSNRKVATLAKLFEGSPWAGGTWSQSLARVKGAIGGRNAVSRTLAGISTRGVEIPLKSIPGMMSFPQDREPAPAPAPGQYSAEDWA